MCSRNNAARASDVGSATLIGGECNVHISIKYTSVYYKYVQFFAYKMTVASENSMHKHRNVDLNTVTLKASDRTHQYNYWLNLKIMCGYI
jgi:hypothetical protein